jgi:hypothetical protein
VVDREKDILFEVSPFTVRKVKEKKQVIYRVYKDGPTVATSHIGYDDLSLAIMDCAYKGGLKMTGKEAVAKAKEILAR